MERTLREIAIAVPSFNQGRYLSAALTSIFMQQGVVPHVAVVDGGSTDETAEVVQQFHGQLGWSRMAPDDGQTPAINEGIDRLVERFPNVSYVAWLNADDVLLPDGLRALAGALEEHADWVAAAGRGQLISDSGRVVGEIATAPFEPRVFDRKCTICQPATLMRRAAWQQIGGLDTRLHMCFDYDLWWRLAALGRIGYVDTLVAASRDHEATKTRTRRQQYFEEGMNVVQQHTGRVPWHWCISEALERESGWRLEDRPGVLGRIRAGGRAMAAYLRRNLSGRRAA